MRKYHSAKDYWDAAKSPETPIEELDFLAKSEYDFVRVGVAQNPNVTSEILASLIPSRIESWNEQTLAAALTENLRTPVEVLMLLATELIPVLNHGRGNDQGFRAGVNLCCNPNTPLDSIREVLNPDKVATQFRKVVARETRRQDVLNLLLSDRSEIAKKRAHESLEKMNRVESNNP
ncbi:MAG: hypothetical protein DMF68_13480 [Acidobacteria bacterium]|nr:MAG: hypothetical protein DMF68_13480 [Acidobacteriota bacterium]